jgi:two-component system, OmpR family, response regulator RegX3
MNLMESLTETFDWSTRLVERAPSVPETFRIGGVLVDRRQANVQSPAGEFHLRTKELELLMHLYEHLTVTFTRDELLEEVWKCQPGLMTRTVDQTVATLRRKIEPRPAEPQFLQTVYGIGYRLVL